MFMSGTIKVVDGDYKGLEAFENVHIKNFLKAVLEVDNTYYYYSYSYQNGPSQMQEHLERVFAYELYHQWSILISEYNKISPPIVLYNRLSEAFCGVHTAFTINKYAKPKGFYVIMTLASRRKS